MDQHRNMDSRHHNMDLWHRSMDSQHRGPAWWSFPARSAALITEESPEDSSSAGSRASVAALTVAEVSMAVAVVMAAVTGNRFLKTEQLYNGELIINDRTNLITVNRLERGLTSWLWQALCIPGGLLSIEPRPEIRTGSL